MTDDSFPEGQSPHRDGKPPSLRRTRAAARLILPHTLVRQHQPRAAAGRDSRGEEMADVSNERVNVMSTVLSHDGGSRGEGTTMWPPNRWPSRRGVRALLLIVILGLGPGMGAVSAQTTDCQFVLGF